MRPSSRQTCSHEAAAPAPTRPPIVAASCPSGAPNKVMARGCSASERARVASGVTALLDDLVGAGEDRLRDSEAERLGGFQIDDKLECGRLLHRQIGRFAPL